MLTSQKRNSRKSETRHGKVEKSTATRCDKDRDLGTTHAPYASLWQGQLYQDLLRPLELFIQLRTYRC